MRTELRAVVAVGWTSVKRPSAGSLDAIGTRLGDIADAGDLVVFTSTTLAAALDAVQQLMTSAPSVAVAVHVGETTQGSDPGRSVTELVTSLVTSLARRAATGEVLVTDVVAQLDAASERTYSGRGHLNVAGRPTRIHVLSGGSDAQATPTFGRAVELASIDWMVDELLKGSGRAVILEGEAGIGKSQIATEAIGRAEASGCQAVRAAADELGRDRPGHLAGGLLSDLKGQSPIGVRHGPGADRGDHRFVDEFTATIETVAQDAPVLVVAEDLHWADELSIRSIGALARRLSPVAAGLVVTFRPLPRPDLLDALVELLVHAGAEHHVLDPLDPEAITSLVASRTGAAPGPRLRDRLVMTAGNPLFVVEMLGALERDGSLDVDSGVVDVDLDLQMPTRLSAIALRRLNDLPSATVVALQHASLLGSSCALDVLATVTNRAAVTLGDVLLPAVQSGVLVLTGDTVRFRHDVIREAIVGDLAPAVRREMHTSAGEALAGTGAPPVQVARQLALGARPGDAGAVAWLERAADEVRSLDPSAAVDLLEEALELAPDGWSGVDRIECMMIEPLTMTGRVDDAIDCGRRVLLRPLEPEIRRLATSGLVSALATRADLGGASDVASRAAADSDIDLHYRLMFDCVATSMRILVDGSTDDARRAAEAALARPESQRGAASGDELACWAHHSLGWAALVDGRYADALEAFDESSRLLERREVADHGFLIPQLNAGTAAAYLDDFEMFDARLRSVMERCAARGDASLRVIGHFGGAVWAWSHGRWDDALTDVEVGLGLASETGAGSMTVGLHAIAGLVHTGRGRPDEADRHLAGGFAALDRGAHLFGADLLMLAQALRLEDDGAADEAAQLLAGFWNGVQHIALALQHRSMLPHVVRLAGPLLGDRCAEVLDAADRAARNTPVPSNTAAAMRCHALVADDHDLLASAVEEQRRSPRLIERAETSEEAAVAAFASGRQDEAAVLVDEAVSIWTDAGASHHVARLDSLARRYGIRRRRSRPAAASHGWEALSPKELEVVDLVADGLSNPAIGERLYISRRTVESHLSHVFTKLGLSNRAQLAAFVAERRHR